MLKLKELNSSLKDNPWITVSNYQPIYDTSNMKFDGLEDHDPDMNMLTIDYKWFGMMIGPEYPNVIYMFTSTSAGITLTFWHRPQNLFTTVCLTWPRLDVYLNETVHAWRFWRMTSYQF